MLAASAPPAPTPVRFCALAPFGPRGTVGGRRERESDGEADATPRRREATAPRCDAAATSRDPRRGPGGAAAPAAPRSVGLRVSDDNEVPRDVTPTARGAPRLPPRGPRACFEFPDGVEFGLQPVRANATEAFLLRNTGNAEGRFVLSVPPPFTVTPSDGRLRSGEAQQLLFGFLPETCGEYSEELVVEYDSGEACFARLSTEWCR